MCLINMALFCCEPLKIGYRRFVQTNGDRLFQFRTVGFRSLFIFEKSYSVLMALPPVLCGFMSSGFPCRDNANRRIVFFITMAHHQNPKLEAHAQHNEAILVA